MEVEDIQVEVQPHHLPLVMAFQQHRLLCLPLTMEVHQEDSEVLAGELLPAVMEHHPKVVDLHPLHRMEYLQLEEALEEELLQVVTGRHL